MDRWQARRLLNHDVMMIDSSVVNDCRPWAMDNGIVHLPNPNFCYAQCFSDRLSVFRNDSLTGWLVSKWVCFSQIDSHWTASWKGKTCLAHRLTDEVPGLRAPKMSVCACLSFRVDISDTLMYVYEMLGAELLSNLYDKLGRLLTNAEQPTSWQVGETCTQMSKEKMGTVFCFLVVFFLSVAQRPELKMCHTRFHKPVFCFLFFIIIIILQISNQNKPNDKPFKPYKKFEAFLYWFSLF